MSLEHSPARDGSEKLTGSVREAAAVLGIGLNNAYELAKAGDIPTRRMGNRIIVLWKPFLRMLDGEAA